MCNIIQRPPRREIWGFGGSSDEAFWREYDWTQVTAVGFLNVNTLEPEGLMCRAHSHVTPLTVSLCRAYTPWVCRERWLSSNDSFHI